MSKYINVRSSHGILTVRKRNGYVVERNIDTTDQQAAKHLESIKGFDINEHLQYWDLTDINSESIDILDLGYWYENENGDLCYEEPENDWREEIKLMRSETV